MGGAGGGALARQLFNEKRPEFALAAQCMELVAACVDRRRSGQFELLAYLIAVVASQIKSIGDG
jgi:hypothetical protein